MSFPFVAITCTSSGAACEGIGPTSTPAYTVNWVTTVGITKVTFQTTEPESNYFYQLVGVPIAAASSTNLAAPSSPSTGIGFATPDPQSYYAQTLGFVNFAPWNTLTQASGLANYCPSPAASPTDPSGYLAISAGVANTPYTLNFCMKVSSNEPAGPTSAPAACGVAARSGYNDITAVPLPTYSCPPGSEAFLGNNGFYTGVPGDPALYTVTEGSTATVTITNIELLSPAAPPPRTGSW